MTSPAPSEDEKPQRSIKSFFSRVPAEKYHSDRKLKHEETKEIRELKRMRAKADEEVMKAAARERETKRKRVYRAMVRLGKGAGVEIEVHENDHKGVPATAPTKATKNRENDSLVRALRQDRELSPNSLQEYHDWFNVSGGTQIVRHLQATDYDNYKSLLPRTVNRAVNRWMNLEKKEWHPSVISRVEDGVAQYGGPGRAKIFKPYPELNKAIVLQLSDLREAGLGVNICSATAIIRSNIDRMVPNLFDEKKFVLSQSFVTHYLKKELDWTYRVATNAAKKTPENAERLCTDAILRISRVTRDFAVPPALVINGDQTGVNLFPAENKTYAKRGSKQVPILAEDDKRHITLIITSSMDGKLFSFQAIFKGKTEASLPGKNERKAAENMGMKFEPGGDKHWANLETTKKWVEEIVISYIKQVKLEQGLSDKRYTILYIDCDVARYNRLHGIIHQVAAPYSPQNNGVAERYNRTIKEMAASMLQGGNIPNLYWPYAVQYASCIINFTGFLEKNLNKEHVPKIHALYGRYPQFKFSLRRFGCDAWAKIPSEIRPKADLTRPKTIHGKFLGIVMEGPGAFILNEDTKKVFITRNVVFREKDLETVPANSNDIDYDSDEDDIRGITSSVPAEDSAGDPVPDPELPTDDPSQPGRVSGIEVGMEPDPDDPDVVALALTAYIEFDTEPDPTSFAEAMRSKRKPEWLEAIAREFLSMVEKKVWHEVIVPEGAILLGTKWVFKTELNELREIINSKLDSSPKDSSRSGVYTTSTRSHLWRGWLDVETAYLNAPLKIVNYIEFPEGYQPNDPKATGLAVTKALYGLTQSAREWWEEINQFITQEMGFKMSTGDWGLYCRNVDTTHAIYILAYVDDFLVVGQPDDIDEAVAVLKRKWKMTDAGSVKWMLGMHIERTDTMLALSQIAYIESLSDRYHLDGCRPISTPLEANARLVPITTNDISADRQKYQSLVGALMWLSLGTRPDITYAVNVLSRFNSNPSRHHYNQALRVLRYVTVTKDKKSTSGYAFFFDGLMVSWASAKQDVVSQSTAESEYVALAAATNEATYLKNLLEDFGVTLKDPIKILCDNQSAITLAKNPAFHKRSKHFGIRYHVTRDKIRDGTIRLTYCPTASQVADIFTKALPRHLFERHVKGLGLV
ncbi:hypothetical protein NCC49_005652 [Naganishia albida]|nr:hypothetical protein NCC49_005652 [Naganishia albida]